MFDSFQQKLLNDWQRDFPLTPEPYARMAESLGVSEQDVIDGLEALKKEGAVSRVGAVVKAGSLGASTLAAMAVPVEELDSVADQVSARHEVNHNYERDHRFNLWFVVTACDDEALSTVLKGIEAQAGYPVMSLPLVEAYHIDLGFELDFPVRRDGGAGS